MAPKKQSRTVVTTEVKVNKRTSVARKLAKLPGKLSEGQEKVVRMTRGIGVEDETALESKTSDPTLLQKLKDMEAELFLRAGLIAPVSKKQQIIDKLKNR